MTFPLDYNERVYASVLGKIIGVYLGRPFEGWTHEHIMADLGEIKYYVHDRHDLPLHNHQLTVTDDDISGTFTFLRALPDYDNSLNLTPAQIGRTWLNYIRECHLFHSLSLEIYCVRPASRMSGSNSSSGRPSCLAIVVRVTCRDSLISYVREPDLGCLPILPNNRCQIDILRGDYIRTSVLGS